MSRDRLGPNRIARMILANNPEAGMVFLAFCHEHPTIDGAIELDAAVETGVARTEEGGDLIVEFSRRLRAAIGVILSDLAKETGQECVNREDIAMHVSGERPKA